MPRKCCSPGSKSTCFYRKIGKKTPRKHLHIIARRTQKKHERWKKMVPFSYIKTCADTVIYEFHWTDDYAKIPARGKPRAKHSPTVWPGVLSSRIPKPMPPSCTTSRASSFVRNAQPDELQEFFDRDSVTFNVLEFGHQRKQIP